MNWKDKKVLVTGGAGFLGSHLTERLIDLGANVTVADILLPNTDSDDIRHLRDRITTVNLDITHDNFNLSDSFDYLFHLAAYAVPTICEKNPDITLKVNVLGTFNVLKFALKNGIKKVIFPSSALLYANRIQYLPIDENHPIQTDDFYSGSKKLGEDLCRFFMKEHGLSVVFLRLFNTYGPRQDSLYVIPSIITQALRDKHIEIWNGQHERDFIFVSDTVDAFIKACESDFVGGPINIGSGSMHQIMDITKRVADRFGATISDLRKEIGPMQIQSNNSAAEKLIGWKPKTAFEEGLDHTIEWFQRKISIGKPQPWV